MKKIKRPIGWQHKENRFYCMKCDRIVSMDKVCDAECEEKEKEVKDFLKAYDKIYGDESPLDVLSEIVGYKHNED